MKIEQNEITQTSVKVSFKCMFDEKNKEDFTGKSERNKIGRINIKI